MKAAVVFRCRIMGCMSRMKRGRWRPRHGRRVVDKEAEIATASIPVSEEEGKEKGKMKEEGEKEV